MTSQFGEYEIDTDVARVQFETVHEWLTHSYWSPGITFERVVRAAEQSSCVVSVYHGTEQVGYMRVISDRTTFAWVADVYVDGGHRHKGIGKKMVEFALNHPEFQGLRRWVLATRDAHDLYSQCGFTPLPTPERWMALYDPNWLSKSPSD